jgi:hypothetical protein
MSIILIYSYSFYGVVYSGVLSTGVSTPSVQYQEMSGRRFVFVSGTLAVDMGGGPTLAA